jgi:hypothetical protein
MGYPPFQTCLVTAWNFKQRGLHFVELLVQYGLLAIEFELQQLIVLRDDASRIQRVLQKRQRSKLTE